MNDPSNAIKYQLLVEVHQEAKLSMYFDHRTNRNGGKLILRHGILLCVLGVFAVRSVYVSCS
jgi:hypothetical protein